MGARLLLAALWLFHWLPLGVQAALGSAVRPARLAISSARAAQGRAAQPRAVLSRARRRASATRLAREHFRWLGRSLLERGLLWYASPERLRRLIQVEGDVDLAERSERPVMWLAPHFMGLDVAGVVGAAVPEAEGHLDLPGAERPGASTRRCAAGACASATPRSSRATMPASALLRAIRRGDALLQPARHGLRHARRGVRAVLRRPGGDPARAVAAGARARHGRAAGGRRDAAGRRGLPRALRGAVDRLPERRPGRRHARA